MRVELNLHPLGHPEQRLPRRLGDVLQPDARPPHSVEVPREDTLPQSLVHAEAPELDPVRAHRLQPRPGAVSAPVHHRHVEGAAAEVKHQKRAPARAKAPTEAVRIRRRVGFGQEGRGVQAGHRRGLCDSPSLAVAEALRVRHHHALHGRQGGGCARCTARATAGAGPLRRWRAGPGRRGTRAAPPALRARPCGACSRARGRCPAACRPPRRRCRGTA
jgi:hypothetical protein